MTLQPDPAAVLVHERLEQAVSAMRAPDVEAGWAALSARLDVPIAPVVPLRKPKRGRTVALAVAAAMMLAGSAFAAVAHFGDGRGDHIAPVVTPVHVPVTGPHAHAPFGGPSDVPAPADHHHGSGAGAGGGAGSGSTSSGGDSSTGSSDGGGSTSKPGDDPNDRDQGTGNDGHHNDHGGGNNGPEGSQPGTSSGSSHGGSDH
jgi:uncharacterized membrane protein YgcG